SFFKGNVILRNKDYDIFTDTIEYHFETAKAFFFGPTDIYTKDSVYLFCRRGWYDTRNDEAVFHKKAFIRDKEKWIYGDSIYYNQAKSKGKAWNNVLLRDTLQKLEVTGDRAVYASKPDFFLITQNTTLKKDMDNDTLYLRSDTLLYVSDTADSVKLLKAYYKTRFFKSDIQGKCDSLVYIFTDSSIFMFHKPIIWSDENQISGEKIRIHITNDEIDTLQIFSTGYIVSRDDSTKLNQVKGAEITGVFKDNKLHKLMVEKNGESVYYFRDENRNLIGVNKANSERIIVLFKNGEAYKIMYYKKPEGTMFPPNKFNAETSYIEGCKWYGDIRPLHKNDIYIWKE
ncbi:MAG: hypothetical protein SNJ71_02265, partial [Bacteroidales bacterium]